MDGPTDDREVQIGMHRSEVEAIVRNSAVAQFQVMNQVEATYEYADGPPAWSKLRALLYAAGDFFTFFATELVFWPIELYADEQIGRIATARYDENLVLQQWTVRRETNSEVLYAVAGEPARPIMLADGPPLQPPFPADPRLMARRPASNRLSSRPSRWPPPGLPDVSSGPIGETAARDSAHPPSPPPSTPPPQRQALAEPPEQERTPPIGGIDFGRYHALVIGNNDYDDFPRLRTATADARAMAELLTAEYGFDVELMIDATRSDIVSSLHRYRQQLGESDNLLIYYAGHGWLDDDTGRGYWLPTDATAEDPSNWVSNGTISDLLKGNPAKHVLVVADTCFSGALTRGIRIPQRPDAYLRKLARKRARTALTSGGAEPVEDGLGEHSVFARAVMNALSANDGVLEAQSLFGQIRRPVMLGAHQTPEYGDIRLAGHEGGDFLFVRPVN